MTKIQIALFIATAGWAACSSAAGDSAADQARRGQARSVVCSGCHGIPGTKTAYPDVYSVPKLGGQHADYIVASLKAYKNNERSNQTMRAQASALSDKDMADIAAFYAGVAPVVAKQ